jgi:hypothetical protein
MTTMPATISKGDPPRKHVDFKPEAQVKELLTSLQDAVTGLTDEALREAGRLVIRAQRTPGALTELSGEIRKRKSQLHK